MFSLVRPTYLLGGLLTPLLGFGSGHVYDELNPTAHKQLTSENYLGHPIQAYFGNEDLENLKSGNKLGFTFSGDCFEHLFDLQHVSLDDSSVDETENFNIEESFVIKPQNIRYKAYGCSLMNMVRKGEDFLFKSETIVRGLDVGWALGSGMKKIDNQTLGLNYYLVFLLFKEGKYRFAGGYSGSDKFITNDKIDTSNLHVYSPDSTVNGFSETSGNDWSKRTYAGFWEESSSGSEIFEKIEVYWKKGNDSKSDGVYGKKRWSERFMYSSERNVDQAGYDSVSMIYLDSKWWKPSSSVSNVSKDVGETLKTMFTPFKDKKGTGTSIPEYCLSSRNKRRVNKQELDKIAGICYVLDDMDMEIS